MTLANTSKTTNVSAQISNDKPILAPNLSRVAYRLFNDSTSTLYLLTGPGTPDTKKNYTCKIKPGGYFEDALYAGIVQGIWEVASGNALVTELT